MAVVLRRGLPVDMPRGVRERHLLREEQQENTSELQKDALHHGFVIPSRVTYCDTATASVRR